MAKKCVNCGAALRDEDIFCTKCGTQQPTEKRCPNCNALLKEDAIFCTKCGTRLDGQTDSPTNTPVKSSNSKKYTKIGIIVGACALVLLILVGVIANLDNNGTSDSSTISIKAEDMANDYIRDQASAEKKYKDKNIKITGQLVNKGQFENTQNYGLKIYSKPAAGKVYSIIIDVEPKNVSMVNKINVGDFVTAEGTCVGIVKQDDPTHIAVEIQSDKVNQ